MQHPRAATKFDRDLGQRIRARRMELKISQADLGAHLDLSFQQIQKYEKGVNRVAPGTLTIIAEKLKMPVTQLMAGHGDLAPSVTGAGMQFLTSPHGVKIASVWPLISDKQKTIIANFITGMAASQMQAAE